MRNTIDESPKMTNTIRNNQEIYQKDVRIIDKGDF